MGLGFDIDISLQAAAFLLHLEEGKMPYRRLLTLLYIAERELLAQKATWLTGDICQATEHGPVLSHVDALIKGNGAWSAEWESYIARSGYSVKLVRQPGRGKLSSDVVDKLTEVSSRCREKGHWELEDLTHDFPEWQKNYPGDGTAALIPVADILEAQGEGADTLNLLCEATSIRQHMNKIFGAGRPEIATETIESSA